MNDRQRRRRQATDDLIDSVARQEFDAYHGTPKLASVAVVIAAYKEADNIGHVLAEMPKRIGEEDVSVIVVIDGEDDGTSSIVREAGHFAVVAPVNRGQGAAFRLGYRIAHEHGAEYVVTADADGQAHASDLEVVLAPVLAGELDFVNGSRRLGRTLDTDKTRNLGIIVFGTLATLLTGTRITDTANPIRAMRAEIAASLTLDEHQYQASELLLGAVMGGYRFGERPVTMHVRKSGESKKGGNLTYGYRYGRVMLRTWRRERARRRALLAG